MFRDVYCIFLRALLEYLLPSFEITTPSIGDKLIPPSMTGTWEQWGPINPYGLGLMTIPYYMEIMGV